MAGRSKAGGEQHLLHKELCRLEEAAKQARGYSRKKLLDEIYDEGRGAKLSPQTISGWIAHGRVPDEFTDLWAFVEGLLRRTSTGRSGDKSWWISKRSEWKGLWEAGKKQSPRAAITRVSGQNWSPTEDLSGFLNAARTVAVEHPYPAVLPGAVLPPLSQVYVRQQTESRRLKNVEQKNKQPDAIWVRRPAEEIVAEDAPVLCLLGGPGAGKSSLLRMIMITLVDQWLLEADSGSTNLSRKSPGPDRLDHVRPVIETHLDTLKNEFTAFTPARAPLATSETPDGRSNDNKGRKVVPLYVSAHDLTRPGSFAQQLAEAVQAQLKGQHYTPLPVEFFDKVPQTGAQWLVLVDGLDEISDIDERLRVLRTLSSNVGTYRFIIASRPLPESELAVLNTATKVGRIPAGRYELLPFDSSQLPGFVKGWMEAACVSNPAAAVDAFMDQVNRGRLRELARNPLMATILCQLHAANLDFPLPRGRFGAYQRFYELLRDRLYDRSPAGINDQLHNQLRRYGRQAQDAIEYLPRQILDALGRMATQQQRENVPDAMSYVKKQVSFLCPQDMPRNRWETLVAQTLRRTGLVMVRGDGMDFVHQTLGEFLAAKYVAGTPECTEKEFHRLSNKDGSSTPSYLTSYDRFLIAAWISEDSCPSGLSDLLRNLSTHYSSAAGISELIRDEVGLGQDIRDSTARTLMKVANSRNLTVAIRAAEDLAAVDISSAVEILSVALKNPRLSFLDRTRVSKKLVEFDVPRAIDVFAEVSMNQLLNIIYRDEASDYLINLDPSRAVPVLFDMIMDRSDDLNELLVLLRKLAKLDKFRAIGILSTMIERHSSNENARRRLSEELFKLESSPAS